MSGPQLDFARVGTASQRQALDFIGCPTSERLYRVSGRRPGDGENAQEFAKHSNQLAKPLNRQNFCHHLVILRPTWHMQSRAQEGVRPMGAVHQLLLEFGKEEALKANIDRRVVEAAAGYLSAEDDEIGFLYSGWAQAALPHRRLA